MSYIINGTEVKVGQVWESKSGARFAVDRILPSSSKYPIVLCELDQGVRLSDGLLTRTAEGYAFLYEPENERNMYMLVQDEIDQPKEQSMQNQIAQIPNLQIEDLRKTVEEPQYKTWGDLPDGTFVMNDDFVFLVNKVGAYAAYSLCGFSVRTCCDEFGSENKIIKVKLQILE